jgi:hypothetical protein
MTLKRSAACLLAVSLLTPTSAFAQQPVRESANRLSAKFWTGLAIAGAGGTAVILGGTAMKTASSTSGNLPDTGYQSCVALKADPIYRENQCDVLKGPNTAMIIGGVVGMAAGSALMLLGTKNDRVTVGAGAITFQHRVKF